MVGETQSPCVVTIIPATPPSKPADCAVLNQELFNIVTDQIQRVIAHLHFRIFEFIKYKLNATNLDGWN